MRRLTSARPSPALVIACVALFVSMGGVSYALATGSIGSREIKNSSIQGKDVGKDEITAREIARRSIDGTDIKINRVGGNAVKEEVLESEKIGKVPFAFNADLLNGKTADEISGSGPRGPAGPAGPKGADGTDGDDGAQGPRGPSDLLYVEAQGLTLTTGYVTQATLDLDAGSGPYYVHAVGLAEDISTPDDPGRIDCQLLGKDFINGGTNNTSLSANSTELGSDGGLPDVASIALLGYKQAFTGTEVDLQCRAETAGAGRVNQIRLFAIKVGSADNQSP